MEYTIFCLIGCVIFGYIGCKIAEKENAKEEKYTTCQLLTNALILCAEGKLDYNRAHAIAEQYAPKFDVERYPLLAHKGMNWYAKEILKSKKIVPEDYSWSHLLNGSDKC